jgi:hypothetical protein
VFGCSNRAGGKIGVRVGVHDMDPSSTISLPRCKYLKSQHVHTCSPSVLRSRLRPTFQRIPQQPIRVRLRPSYAICRGGNDDNRLGVQQSSGGTSGGVAVSVDGTLAANALETSGEAPRGEVRWRRTAQAAVIAAAAVSWFLIAQSQPLSPFLSLTAAATGMSKEGELPWPLQQRTCLSRQTKPLKGCYLLRRIALTKDRLGE